MQRYFNVRRRGTGKVDHAVGNDMTLRSQVIAVRTCYILTGILLGLLLFAPHAAQALELNKYVRMTIEDRARYVETLLRGSESFLRRSGQAKIANTLVSAFDTRYDGEKIPRGIEQFGRDLQAAESYQIRQGRTLHVEHVMLVTFKKFGIEIPRAEMMSFAKDFRPTGGR